MNSFMFNCAFVLFCAGSASAQTFEVVLVPEPLTDEQIDYKTAKTIGWLAHDTNFQQGLPDATPGTLTGTAKMFQALAQYMDTPPPILQLAQE